MTKAASIRGTAVGGAAAYADLVAAVDTSGIKPSIDRTFPFDEVKDTYRAQASPEIFGKIVINLI